MTTLLSTIQERLSDAIGDKSLIYADSYTKAINQAIRQLYPTLHKHLDSIELITGNIGPNFHFTDWAATTIPDFFSSSSTGGLAEATTINLTWGGGSSALFTNSGGADEYICIDSDDYPRLLDLMGQTVSFKVWARPSADDDAWIQIYTVQPTTTGTITQTLPATHTVADLEHTADQWTLIELENQSLNDNLDKIEFRFYIHTADATCYFDNARITGLGVYEYLLPTDFQNGKVSQVFVQSSGMADDACDDFQIRSEDPIYNWKIVEKDIGGTVYKYLRLPSVYTHSRKLHLVGYGPLEALSDDSDTLSVDEPRLELLIAKSASALYRMEQGLVSSQDRDKYRTEIAFWDWEVMKLSSRFGMSRPSKTLRFQ